MARKVANFETAVNIFLYQCVLRGGLPFKIEKPYYIDEVIEAMAEALRISKDVNIKGYKKIDELKQSLTEN